MKFLGCLVLLASTHAFGQGYDTTCSYNGFSGVVECNTRPDAATQWEQTMRRLEQASPMPDPFAMPDQGGPLPIPGALPGNLGGAEASRLLQQFPQQRQLPLQQFQIGILKTTRQETGKLLCYYVPARGKKFHVKGASQDGVWYQAPTGRCGQQLRMTSDGRGWFY